MAMRPEYERKFQMQRIKSRCDNTMEEPLPAGGSCLLGAMNLAEFVDSTDPDQPKFDWKEFISAVGIATRALNDVLDEGLRLHPLKEQRDSVRDWRQIGLT